MCGVGRVLGCSYSGIGPRHRHDHIQIELEERWKVVRVLAGFVGVGRQVRMLMRPTVGVQAVVVATPLQDRSRGEQRSVRPY